MPLSFICLLKLSCRIYIFVYLLFELVPVSNLLRQVLLLVRPQKDVILIFVSWNLYSAFFFFFLLLLFFFFLLLFFFFLLLFFFFFFFTFSFLKNVVNRAVQRRSSARKLGLIHKYSNNFNWSVTLTSLFLFTLIRIRNTVLKRLLFSKYLSYINTTKDKNSTRPW